jgi:hypothetical protein
MPGPIPIPRDAVPRGDNEWGIPDLLLSHCWQGRLPAPVAKWGTFPRRSNVVREGTYQFYTDDYKFSGLWSYPNTVRDTGVRVLVEPNYSTHEDMALAEVLWRIYKKRWLARYWQEHLGLSIVVDLGTNPRWWPYSLVGVPRTWQGWAVRWIEEFSAQDIIAHYNLALEHTGGEVGDFHLFGGYYRGGQQLAESRGWHWYSKGMKSHNLLRRITGTDEEFL